MVDLSNIGKSIASDPLAAAGAAQAAGKSNRVSSIKNKIKATRGLGLEDIPGESPYVPVEDNPVLGADEQMSSVEQADAAQSIGNTEGVFIDPERLRRIDMRLATAQAMLKKLIAPKIKYADKNPEYTHRCLVSIYEDTKNTYLEIHQARQEIC